jgi:phosphohistidine phosphatase
MLTLSLLRHAKSSWADRALEDHERPLAKRGTKAAGAMGAFIAKQGLRPDLVLCSGAVRTRATLALVLPALGAPPPQVVFDDVLYMATPAALLGRVRQAQSDARHVMVIGHNPGLHALALELTGKGNRDDVEALATKFPTCALAVLTFKARKWPDIGPGAGTLDLFMTPRRLP